MTKILLALTVIGILFIQLINSTMIADGLNKIKSIKTDNKEQKYNGFYVDSLTVYNVISQDLSKAIERVFEDEKKCANYSKYLVFNIRLYEESGHLIIEMSDRSIKIYDHYIDMDSYIGCFDYEGHRFTMSGDSLFEGLFIKTNLTLPFKVYRYYGAEDSTKNVVPFILAESEYRWGWEYKNHKMQFLGKETCEEREERQRIKKEKIRKNKERRKKLEEERKKKKSNKN